MNFKHSLPIQGKLLAFLLLFLGSFGFLALHAQTISGLNHALLICKDSTVWGSGYNQHGQIGSGTQGNTSIPLACMDTTGLSLDSVISLATGYRHSLALKADGTVWVAGSNVYGQLGLTFTPAGLNYLFFHQLQGLTGIVQVAAGNSISVALKNDGTVYTWGRGIYGELGQDTLISLPVPTLIPNLSGITQIACGSNHTLAIRQDGALFAWGNNGYGQCGDTTASNIFIPYRVDSSLNWKTVAAGVRSSIAIQADSTLWTWGQNNSGQGGLGHLNQINTPTRVPGIQGIVGASGGRFHSFALTAWGTVLAAGNNSQGQLGNGTLNPESIFQPVPGLSNIVEIASGEAFGMARRADGLVWAWGQGVFGQMGVGSLSSQLTPIVFPLPCLLPALVEGEVYDDRNGNCQKDPGEIPLGNQIIKAEGSQTYYATTNANGHYQLPLGPGNYDLTVIPLSPYWTASSCTLDTIPLVVTATPTQIQLDFPRFPLLNCPQLAVNIGGSLFRPCRPAQFFIDYCNIGTVDEHNAVLSIQFDTLFQPTSSTFPWNTPVTGNTYEFLLDTVRYGSCGSFMVTGDVSCNALSDQGICAYAQITPDSLCTAPHPLWDGSHIEVSASCNSNDSVRFVILNTGVAMTGNGNLIVLEDNLMRLHTQFMLTAGDSMVLTFEGRGSTWFCRADQSPFHPGNSKPSAFIEACGVNQTGGFSTGFLTALPLNDADPFVDIYCDIIRNSYDPNDKTSEPAGVSPAKYIESTDGLEYLVRFQNTGNDTAFNVVLIDSLSAFLDPATFRPGVASHPYTWQLSGQKELEFRFENILLPDSNVNEPASHGFVTFSIDQTAGNTPGTVIENQVGIYFDYNAPVLTNIEFNTIEIDFLDTLLLSVTQHWFTPDLAVKVYPNPMQESTTLEWESNSSTPMEFLLYDLTGRVRKKEVLNSTKKFTLSRGTLEAGIYIYCLKQNGIMLHTGKIVAQ